MRGAMISPQRGHLTAGPRHLVIDTKRAAGPRIPARSVVMASSSHGAAHRAEHNQDEANDQQDETDRPQDRDFRDKAYDQQQNAQRDHERSFCDVTRPPGPWMFRGKLRSGGTRKPATR